MPPSIKTRALRPSIKNSKLRSRRRTNSVRRYFIDKFRLNQLNQMIVVYICSMKIAFADRLKQLRKENELSQRQLAGALQTTQRKISYWEQGAVEPDLENLWRLADYFDVTIDELVGRKDF